MGDYTKQTWVDDDGSGAVGSVFTKARMDAIEQGIFDATKQASMDVAVSFDGSNATVNDKKRIVWRRLSDGTYLGSVQLFEGGSGATQIVTLQDRAKADGTTGAIARRIMEALQSAGAPIITGAARLVAESIRGGRQAVRAEVRAEGAVDPTFSATILDDTGYSDFSRPTIQVGGALPSTPYEGQEVIYIADATNGVAWHLKYRSAQAGSYKWLVIGGSPLQVGPLSQNAGGDTFNNGGAYAAASNTGGTGPNVSIPLAGDYDVTLTAYQRHGAAGGVIYFSFSPPSGAAATDADALHWNSATSNQEVRHSKVVRKAGLTVGTLSARYRATGPSSVGLVDERAIQVMPVRVG